MVFFFIFLFLFFIFIFFSVAFLTLMERHILGLSQNRIGVIKVSFLGILQCLFDGLKLFKKELFFPEFTFEFFFFFLPFFIFFLMVFEWSIMPYFFLFFSSSYLFLFFLCIVGVLVYFFILVGFFSKSKYAILGAIRFSSQSISFEILFFFFLFSFFFYLQSLNFFFIFNYFFFIYFFLFLILFLVELNRAPFDFSEGESELVSGFNLEFGSVFFVLLFLSEYGFMIFFCILMSFFFFFGYMFMIFFFLFLFLVIRSVYPRYRYDLLMEFFWLKVLPWGLLFFFFVFIFIFLF